MSRVGAAASEWELLAAGLSRFPGPACPHLGKPSGLFPLISCKLEGEVLGRWLFPERYCDGCRSLLEHAHFLAGLVTAIAQFSPHGTATPVLLDAIARGAWSLDWIDRLPGGMTESQAGPATVVQ